MSLDTSRAATTIDYLVNTGLIADIKGKSMTNVEKIMGFIGDSAEPVTVKQLQDALDIRQNLLSGTLVMLVKSGRLAREKLERTTGTGPKMQWAYKVVANTQQEV